MAALGYTSGDPRKVSVTGDTMTGDLILAGATTDLDVGGVLTDAYQGVSGDLARLLATGLSTGLTSGGTLSINGNPALIDVAAATGWVVDYNSSGVIGPTNPALTYVDFPGAVGVALIGPPAQQATYWLLSSAGSLVQQANPPTRPQTRTHIFLGASVQSGGINFAVRSLPMVQSQPGAQYVDLLASLGAFNTVNQDNSISANGVNLKVNTTGGNLFVRAYGLNFGTYQNPHIAALSAQSPASYRYATATALLPGFVSDIDVANYDPGGLGVVTPIGGGAFTSTIHRVFVGGSPLVNEQLVIQYGQTAYGSLAAAEASIGAGNFIVNPLFTGTVTAYIAVTRTATDLSNVTQAKFSRAAKFASP